jgi:hypothetical protein
MSFTQLRSPRINNPLANPSVATAPTVTTQAASNLTATTADGNGTVTSDGGSALTARGFVWSTSLNPTLSDSVVTDGATTVSSYVDTMSPLIASTLYHYRAYATNAIGTSYGADTTFTTSAAGGAVVVQATLLLMGVG